MACLSPPAAAKDAACAAFEGAVVVNSDGDYIGRISSRDDSDSIFNPYGTYGSRYSGDSIWNRYGDNGNPYSTNSAFNRYTVDPPKIIKNRRIIGDLSVNNNLDAAVNPTVLGVMCYDFEVPN